MSQGRVEEALPHYLFRFQSAAWGRELDALRQVKPPGPNDHFSPGTVVVGEQGLGDEIYLLKLLAGIPRPAHWTYVGDRRLAGLFSRTFRQAAFLARSGDNIGGLIQNTANVWRFDHVLRYTANHAPLDHNAVLRPDPRMEQQWREKLDEIDERPKVGLSWTGGLRRIDRLQREVAPQSWVGLAGLNDFTFIDIQYDDRPHDRQQLELHLKKTVHRLDGFDLVNKLDNSAALLTVLDHVVTVDNATAHLAGALGVNTSVLLHKVPDWRWGLAGEGALIYPSLQLMRQHQANDWHSPLTQLRGQFT